MKRFIFVLVIPFLVFLVIILNLKLQRVSCVSQYGICNSELVDGLVVHEGTSLIGAYFKIKDYLALNQGLKEYSVDFVLPSSYRINALMRKPVAAIKRESEFFLVDVDGVIIDNVVSTQLPYIELQSNVSHDEAIFGAFIISELYSYFGIHEALVTNDGIFFKLREDVNIIFPREGDVDLLLGGLQLIFSRLNTILEDSRIEKGNIQIDFRFNNPVVKNLN